MPLIGGVRLTSRLVVPTIPVRYRYRNTAMTTNVACTILKEKREVESTPRAREQTILYRGSMSEVCSMIWFLKYDVQVSAITKGGEKNIYYAIASWVYIPKSPMLGTLDRIIA